MFSRIHKKYDQYDQIDALASVQKKVEEVKTVMHENIVIALDNCVKLEKLEQDSGKMKANATFCQLNFWFREVDDGGRSISQKCQEAS